MTRSRCDSSADQIPELVEFITTEGFAVRAIGTPPSTVPAGCGQWWMLGLGGFDRDSALIAFTCDGEGSLTGTARIWTPQHLAEVTGDAATGVVAALIASEVPYWPLLSAVQSDDVSLSLDGIDSDPTLLAMPTPCRLGLPPAWRYQPSSATA